MVGRSPPRLIALDWGTSNLRASLLNAEGHVLDTRGAAGGVMAVPERRFEAALTSLVGDWMAAHRLPLIASGMIGSRQGWREAPYLDCPAGLEAAAARLTPVLLADRADGTTLHIVPGLRCQAAAGHFDVMRGEETQLWGAGLAAGGVCVLPGTHAKWARSSEGGEGGSGGKGGEDGEGGGRGEGAAASEGGRIERFATWMTGELYALLTQHSILGRLMQFGHARPAAFEQGVRLGLAEYAQATQVIFAARTAGLMGQQEPEALPDFLSGLLIGIEIGSATHSAWLWPDAAAPMPRVTVLGEAALAARYITALGLAGIAAQPARGDATTRGLWLLAQAAGLLKG